jgi:hypothetical protein
VLPVLLDLDLVSFLKVLIDLDLVEDLRLQVEVAQVTLRVELLAASWNCMFIQAMLTWGRHELVQLLLDECSLLLPAQMGAQVLVELVKVERVARAQTPMALDGGEGRLEVVLDHLVVQSFVVETKASRGCDFIQLDQDPASPRLDAPARGTSCPLHPGVLVCLLNVQL